VLFKPLSDAEIAWYIDTDEPFDKAGAYALQGIGAFMVRAVYGSYTNVIGLPICELIETLEHEGLIRFSPGP
jgi:septum formation protein